MTGFPLRQPTMLGKELFNTLLAHVDRGEGEVVLPCGFANSAAEMRPSTPLASIWVVSALNWYRILAFD